MTTATAKIDWKRPASAELMRGNLHHQIAAAIGFLIAQGKLTPGSVLPNESELASEFGVSRTALREAVKVLDSKGLVEVRRKTGTRVRPATEWSTLDHEVLSWLFSGNKPLAVLADLSEMRRIFEPAAARMTAARAGAHELVEIEAAFRLMEDAASNPASSIEPTLRFHLAIVEASQNIFMRPLGALIQIALRSSVRLTSNNVAAYKKTLRLHRAVLQAVRNGNEKAAERAMLAVLDQTSSNLLDHTKADRRIRPRPRGLRRRPSRSR